MKPGNYERFINRELSWLEFNQRVLEEVLDERNPILERLKFFCIVSSNLDEFFEVRVAGLKQQMQSGSLERSADGLTPAASFQALTARARRMVEDQYRCWRQQLVPMLARKGVRFLKMSELDRQDLDWLERYYRAEVRPTITPLSIDPSHPFPQLLNKSLNLMVRVRMLRARSRRRRLAVVQLPRNLPRLVQLPREDGRRDYVFLGQLLGYYLADLFPGTQIEGQWMFRVTRNSELYIDEEEMSNLLKAVENELHRRMRGSAVRLEVETDCPPEVRSELLRTMKLGEEDLYVVDGPLSPGRIMAVAEGEHPPEWSDPPFRAPIAAALGDKPDLFAAIREGDLLLHHPYESFDTVVSFLQHAAADPCVLAIKQTLYRTGGDPRIIGSLSEAVRNGKQVTAVVELKARFDEANNIQWARKLEEAGVHVVYGVVGYKIHCKMTLVVRRDEDGIRRYVHLATGNYNPTTAKIYTDLGLLTCHPDFGEDVTNLFNLLTGICQFEDTRKLVVAPFTLHDRMLQLIRREAENARKGLPARIIAKMNSLVGTEVIEALYEASQAGVQIDLIVRGICCLRPERVGTSENIRVRSIVGRFLEHSRIFYFENACRPEVFLGSADWMPRNFFKRIEVVFPVEDGRLRDRIIHELLALPLADNVKARTLDAQGVYRPIVAKRGEALINSQVEFMKIALGEKSRATRGAPAKKAFPRIRLAPKPTA